MKKSEMLKLMMNTFHEGMTYKEKMLSGISEEQAEKLLSAIEKAGMLPPKVKTETVREGVDLKGEKGTFISWTYKSVWEPENEKK